MYFGMYFIVYVVYCHSVYIYKTESNRVQRENSSVGAAYRRLSLEAAPFGQGAETNTAVLSMRESTTTSKLQRYLPRFLKSHLQGLGDASAAKR